MTKSLRHAFLIIATYVCATASGQLVCAGDVVQVRSGSAAISGVVTTDEPNGRPIRRAVVSLTSGEQTANRSTVTDDDGRFSFTRLPASSFKLSATKTGYLAAYYGAREAGWGTGVSFALSENEQMTVSLKMLRGAVITGTVTNDMGQPAQASMQILQYRVINGERTLASVVGGYGYVSSDDRGQYRMFGLPPGEYIVAATPGLPAVVVTRQTSAADVQWAMRQLQGGAAGGTAPDPAPPQGPPVMGVPVYYPGTVDLAAATPVVVRPGDERADIDFGLQVVPSARLEGTLVDPDGRPTPSAQIILIHKALQPGDYILSTGTGGRTASNGRFSISGVGPGQYLLAARSQRPGSGTASVLWATADVTVAGRDVSDIALTLEPGLTLSGRLVFDGAQPPTDLTRVRVSMASAQSGALSLTLPPISPGADGAFAFSGLIPGKYRITVTTPGSAPDGTPAWIVRSVRAGNQDAADIPLEITRGDAVPEVVVTMTDQLAEISGALQDTTGRAASGVSIVLMPVDRRMWIAGARRVRAIRPGADGRYRIGGLPAGEYLIAAAAAIDQNDLSDTALLEQLAASAVRVVLAQGEKKVQDLRMAR